eukprot:scaffold14244_cov129-Isochrysis_galbana.AAC.3
MGPLTQRVCAPLSESFSMHMRSPFPTLVRPRRYGHNWGLWAEDGGWSQLFGKVARRGSVAPRYSWPPSS